MKVNIINLPNRRESKKLPANAIIPKSQEIVRIPIFERIYEVDGELMYELKNDKTPRKLKDYSHMDFN